MGHERGHGPLTISSRQVADIATNAWKARSKMLDPVSREVRDEMKRAYRHVEAILASLAAIGIDIKDHTGEAFDYGQPLKVVTTQPSAEVAKDTVVETIRPTISWQNQIIQMGEVVIGTPTQK
jgi:molecular chaperone GrpE (heat shock protein)